MDIADFDGESDPLTTALSVIEYKYSPRQSYYASFVPYELRERTTLEQEVTLGGTQYEKGEELQVQYRYYDTVFGWRYNVLSRANWHLNLGVDLSLQRTLIKFTGDEDSDRVSTSDWTAMLAPAFDLQYHFYPRLGAKLLCP